MDKAVASTAILLMLLLSGAVIVTVPEVTRGAVLFVGAGSTYATIGSAIENSSIGDTIAIAPGHYAERIIVTRTLDIRGNGTGKVFLEPSSGLNSELLAPFTRVSGLVFVNHTLRVSSDNVTLGALGFSLQGGTGLQVDKAKNFMASDLTFSGSPERCVAVDNSTHVTLSKVAPAGTESTVVSVSVSTHLTVKDMDWDLTGIGSGFVMTGLNAMVHDCIISSRSAGTGIGFQGNDLILANVTLSMQGTGLNAAGDRIGLLSSTVGSTHPGDIGVLLRAASNVTVNATAFEVGEGALGIDAVSVADMTISSTTAKLDGDGARFLDGGGLLRSTIIDLTATTNGDGQRTIAIGPRGSSAFGSRSLLLTNSTFSHTGDGTTILSLRSCDYSTVSNDLFNVIGDRDVAIDASGQGIMMDRDSLAIDGMSSAGAVMDGTNYTIDDAVFWLQKDATGLTMRGSDGAARDSMYVSYGSGESVLIEGTNCTVSDCTFYSNSAGGCIEASGTGSVIGGDMRLGGEGAGGIRVSSGGDLSVEYTILFADPGAGTPLSTSNGSVRVLASSFVLNSSGPAIDLNGGNASLNEVMAGSNGASLRVDGTNLSIASSRISRVSAYRTNARIEGSDLRSDGSDLIARSGSRIAVLDTEASSIVSDATSVVEVSSTISLLVLDGDDMPVPGVEIAVTNDLSNSLYTTPLFDGPDPITGPDGLSGPFVALDRIYGAGAKEVRTDARLVVNGTATLWDRHHVVEAERKGTVKLWIGDIDYPQVPMNVRVRALSTLESLMVQWDPNYDDTSQYRVYHQDGAGWTRVGEVLHPTTSWTSPDLGPSITGVFTVTAFDGSWESYPSASASNTTLDLTAPSTPEMSLVEQGIEWLTLGWTSGGEVDLAGFVLEMNSTPSMTQFRRVEIAGPSDSALTIEGLAPGTSYGFRVKAFDLSGNDSPFSALMRCTTLPRLYTIVVGVSYSGGPLDGSRSNGSIVRLLNFNGTLMSTTESDEVGNAFFHGLAEDFYMIEAAPEASLRGIEGVLRGYLENATGFIEASGKDLTLRIDIALPYYDVPVHGSVSVQVSYGPGDRSGPVFNALVELWDGSGVVEARSTDDLGRASFLIRTLPFTGRFRVVPPEPVAAIPGEKAGYIERTTQEFNLTEDSPEGGTIDVVLEFMGYSPPPHALSIVWKSPSTSVRILDEPIIVTFNQPVDARSVVESMNVTPALGGAVFTWTNENQTLTVDHDDFSYDTVYRVTIGPSARSVAGTSFPDGYTNNTWEFRTGKVDDRPSIPLLAVYILLAILVAVLIGASVFIYLKQPGKDDLEDAEEDIDPYSYDYLDEGAYQSPSERVEGKDEGPPEEGASDLPKPGIEDEGEVGPEGQEIEGRREDAYDQGEDDMEMLEDEGDFLESEPAPKPKLRVIKGG